MAGDDIDALNYDDLEGVAHLTSSERYQGIMGAVRKAAERRRARVITAVEKAKNITPETFAKARSDANVNTR